MIWMMVDLLVDGRLLRFRVLALGDLAQWPDAVRHASRSLTRRVDSR